MAQLYSYGNQVKSVFQLLGEKENDISYSIAWALSSCRKFLSNYLQSVGIKISGETDQVTIKLQHHEKEKGFTDIEIEKKGDFFLLIEAKRGWNFPSKSQLEKYASRHSFQSSSAKIKKIIVFNESTPAYTAANFPISKINEFEVVVRSWRDLYNLIPNSISIGRDAENRLLRELQNYLERIITMQKVDNNWVYVVSLGHNPPPNWKISWIDIVEKKKMYFHPVGGGKGGWPAEPPNYIAFRYNGILQSIHHIDKYEVFTNPHSVFSEIPSENWGSYYIYYLGPSNNAKLCCKGRA